MSHPSMPVPAAIAAMRATVGAPWRTPTRRTFLTMLGLGSAAIAVGGTLRERVSAQLAPPRHAVAGTVRWIGHC